MRISEFQISEIMQQYVAEQDAAGHWRVRNRATEAYIEGVYSDERMARAGARLAAACDIRAHIDAEVTRRCTARAEGKARIEEAMAGRGQ